MIKMIHLTLVTNLTACKGEATSTRLLLTCRCVICKVKAEMSSFLFAFSFSSNDPYTVSFVFLSSPSLHYCEVMSPWHEGRNILHSPCRSIRGLTCGSQEILNGDGLAAEHLPLSNYMTASREGELQLCDPFMAPNIPFLFILNLFVQSSPLMLTAPSSARLWKTGKRHKHRVNC